MGVLQMGTSATDKLFLEYIKPGMHIQFVQNTVLYDRFKTKTDSCMGRYGVMKLQTKSAKSARPSSSSTFPTAQQGSYDEFIFYMKRGMYASLQFDGLALACSKGKGAVKDIIKTEIEGQMIYISNRLNRQFWGDGSGRLAQINGAVSASTTVYVDGPLHGQDTDEYTDPSTYLEEEQYVDIYNAGVLYAENVKISSIALGGSGQDTLTMADDVTCPDDSYIFDTDTYAASEGPGTGVPAGLYTIINSSNPYVGTTSTSAFQNIDRDSYTFAQAQMFDMGGIAVTNKKVLECIHKLEKWGTIDVVITNGAIWRNWAEILWGDKTMPNDPVFWGGIAGMGFYGGKKKLIPIIWDDDCPDGRIYFIDDSKIVVSAPTGAGMEWLPGDTGRILYRVQGKDEFAANLRWYYNVTCKMPQSLGCLYDVAHLSS